MSIITYSSLTEFKDNYLLDYSDFCGEKSLLRYYTELLKQYNDAVHSDEKMREFYDSYESLFEIFNYSYEDFFYENGKLFNEIISFFNNEQEIISIFFDYCFDLKRKDKQNILKEYILRQNLCENTLNKLITVSSLKNKISFLYEIQIVNPIREIIGYLEEIKTDEEIKLKNPFIIKQDPIVEIPLTKSQTEKIGLLIRSGIIDYLREKNPKITNNQIAGFIDLLTQEPLKKTSINPHLSKSNSKYAIQNQQDKDDLDFILNKFGISPQSE